MREEVFSGAIESVREHHEELQCFRGVSRIEARRRNARALQLRFSVLCQPSAAVHTGGLRQTEPPPSNHNRFQILKMLPDRRIKNLYGKKSIFINNR